MDVKGELLTQIKPSELPYKGGLSFSAETFLKNLRFAVKNRKFMSILFGSLALWSTITNPFNTPNPEPYLRNLMFGPKVEVVGASPLTPPAITVDTIPPSLEAFAKNPTRIKDTLRWKNLVEQVIADKRLNIKAEDRQNWVNHMLKLIFIESEGKPEASSGIAFGLTQLKDSTAQELAQDYQIRRHDLNNAWDNVFLGAAHQLKMSKTYGTELSAWVHHLGAGNMNQALRSYLVSEQKLPISEVNNIFTSPEGSQLLSQYIVIYRITPEKLLKSSAVTAKLKEIGAWGDHTWEYYDRYKASGIAMGLKDDVNFPQTRG